MWQVLSSQSDCPLMKEDTMTETTTTVPTTLLRDGLRAVIPGASTDKTMPVLNAVRLTLTRESLTLHATDRYVLMEYVAEIPDDERTDAEGEVTFTLALDDAKALVKATPTRPNAWDRVALTVAAGATEYATPILTAALTGGPTFTFAANEGEFPQVRRLFPENGDFKVEGALGLGHKQLSQLLTASKHLDKSAALAFTAGDTPTKPVVATVEGVDAWRGLIMPRRLSTAR